MASVLDSQPHAGAMFTNQTHRAENTHVVRLLLAALICTSALPLIACDSEDKLTNAERVGTQLAHVSTLTAIPPPARPTRVPATPTPNYDLPGVPQLQGLDPAPRAATPDVTRNLAPAPAPPIQVSWDHTVLYDAERPTAIDLGVGSIGSFSPDGRFMTWASGDQSQSTDGDIWVIDLETMEKRVVGRGIYPNFRNERIIGASVFNASTGRRDNYTIDAYTGETYEGRFSPTATPLGSTPGTEIPGGARLVTLQRFNDYRAKYAVYDAKGTPVFQFEAADVRSAGNNELVVMTTPIEQKANIYVVSIPQSSASFVATVNTDYALLNFALSADADYVVWNAYCLRGSKVGLYDRRRSVLVEIDAHEYVSLTPNGLLAFGAFGAKSLVDPSTLEYVFAIGPGGDSRWSKEYRFATKGIVGGHGGLCG